MAQINGRNAISWEKKFENDLKYIEKVNFLDDYKIIIKTIGKLLKREGINYANNATTEKFIGNKEKINV